MASCAQEIANAIRSGDVSSIEEFHLNTDTYLQFKTLQKVILAFAQSNQDTVKFSVTVKSEGSIDLTLAIFKYDAAQSTLLQTGSVAISSIGQSFQIDFSAGAYFFCITNRGAPCEICLTGIASNFQTWANLMPTAYDGEQVVAELTAKKPKPPGTCTQAILYEIVEGSLPPGIFMTQGGRLYGTLPNLDCCEENAELSPSVDWFGQYPNGEWHPWGRQWRFKVKIYVEGFPAAVETQWFCIRVYNNWDLDKENFEKQIPFSFSYEVVEHEEETVELEPQCSPCPAPKEPPAPQPLPCFDCVSAPIAVNEKPVQTITVPEEVGRVTVDNIVVWYQRMMNQDRETMSAEMRKFLDDLLGSSVFMDLLIKKGLIQAENEKRAQLERTRIALVEMKGQIQLRESEMIDGRNAEDIDHEFISTATKLNQTLPMDFVALAGEYSYL